MVCFQHFPLIHWASSFDLIAKNKRIICYINPFAIASHTLIIKWFLPLHLLALLAVEGGALLHHLPLYLQR